MNDQEPGSFFLHAAVSCFVFVFCMHVNMLADEGSQKYSCMVETRCATCVEFGFTAKPDLSHRYSFHFASVISWFACYSGETPAVCPTNQALC